MATTANPVSWNAQIAVAGWNQMKRGIVGSNGTREPPNSKQRRYFEGGDMLRIIIKSDDASMAANAGGSVLVEYKTFNVSLPQVEAYLSATLSSNLAHRQVVGIELLQATHE